MRSALLSSAASVCFCGLLVTSPTQAGFVSPGGSASFDMDDIVVPPGGELLASDTRILPITYIAPVGFTFTDPNTTQVQFHSEVRRDAATGKLLFYYDLTVADDGSPSGAEGSLASLESFADFTTDVTGAGKKGLLTVARSSGNGKTFTLDGGDDGVGFPPTVSILTNADNFNSNGSLLLSLTDAFGMSDIEGSGSVQLATGTVTVDRAFQPAIASTPIPLPAPLWAGLATLAASALALRKALK